MRIALLGYGKMGKMIERIAIERGHEIVLIVDENNRAACTDEQLNIFFQLNKYLAKMMNGFNDYKVFIEETHHIHKLDAPSGTAITIAEGILGNHDGYRSWQLNEGRQMPADVLPVTARRIGEVPGIHAVTYKSEVDEIEIRHSAVSREGFARGAVLAAEFLKGKNGVLGMEDMLKF